MNKITREQFLRIAGIGSLATFSLTTNALTDQFLARKDTTGPVTILDHSLIEPGGIKWGRERLLYDIPGRADTGAYILDLEPGTLEVDKFESAITNYNPTIQVDFTKSPYSIYTIRLAIAEKDNPSVYTQSRGEASVTVDPNQANLLVARWTNWSITAVYWNKTLQPVRNLDPWPGMHPKLPTNPELF